MESTRIRLAVMRHHHKCRLKTLRKLILSTCTYMTIRDSSEPRTASRSTWLKTARTLTTPVGSEDIRNTETFYLKKIQ